MTATHGVEANPGTSIRDLVDQVSDLIDLKSVRRIETEHGSHIEPELDQRWPNLLKLQWRAAVLRADTGLEIEVVPAGRGGVYNIQYRNGSYGPLDFNAVWTYINGIDLGHRLTLPTGNPPALVGVPASSRAPGRESEHSASRTTNERLPG